MYPERLHRESAQSSELWPRDPLAADPGEERSCSAGPAGALLVLLQSDEHFLTQGSGCPFSFLHIYISSFFSQSVFEIGKANTALYR